MVTFTHKALLSTDIHIYICLLSTSLSSLSFRAQLALIILIAGRRDDKSLQDGYLL